MLMHRVLSFGLLIDVVKSTLQTSSLESFKQCLISTPISLGHCLGIGALTKLQSIDNDPEFDVVDGVTFAGEQHEARETYNFLDRDPGSLRTIVDSVGQVFSRRSLKWDMDFVYPGLAMRVAPSVTPGGVLEFVMDPRREALSQHTLKEIGTGRLMARQFLLPLLLGFKFNVTTVIPIIFGIIAIVAKKALFLSKIGLIISTAVALGTILFNSKPHHPLGGGGVGGGHFNPAFGGNYGHYAPPYRYPNDDQFYNNEDLYRGGINNEYNDENEMRLVKEVQEERSRKDNTAGRNFAWNEAEKKEKT